MARRVRWVWVRDAGTVVLAALVATSDHAVVRTVLAGLLAGSLIMYRRLLAERDRYIDLVVKATRSRPVSMRGERDS